ncbi:MAG TPA: serine hydrolase [Candidatus Eisenbacteria bacterium]|nr:serine hydrolase [Candidatus Eisenbacteria bacterium]
MRSGFTSIACIALASLIAIPALAAPAPDSVSAQADRYLAARTALGQFSGAALIARGGRVLLRKGYGYADVERRVPFTPETQQEVASVSKMFTAMAALKLRDQGKLRLEDSLGQWLPNVPAAWRGITLQQLMRHTSGIPDYEEKLEIGSPAYMEFMGRKDASARIVEEAKAKPLDFKPGERFHYSNTGYVVLSRVVERAAGRPFAQLVTRELLRPAGMSRSGVFDGGPRPTALARGYTHGDLGWPRQLGGVSLGDGHLQLVPPLPLAPPAGDAGLYSTVDDLYRWSLVMDGSALVPAALAAEVFTPGLDDYGYGWFAGRGFDRRRYRHNGILPGHLTDFIKFPDDSITIVLVSNLDRVRLDRVARDVSAIALGTPWDPPVHGAVTTLSPAQIAALEGTYRMADGKTLTVRMDGEMLTAKLEGRYTAGLIPLSPTEFYFPLGDGRALFTLGDDGRGTRVNMRYGGEDHIAERQAP